MYISLSVAGDYYLICLFLEFYYDKKHQWVNGQYCGYFHAISLTQTKESNSKTRHIQDLISGLVSTIHVLIIETNKWAWYVEGKLAELLQ